MGRDSVEHFASNWDAGIGKVEEKLPAHAQALVDLEGLVDIGIVDETLPADSGTGLLEVGTHDDEEVIFVLLLELEETLAVVEGSGRIVNRAGTNNDEETVLGIFALEDSGGLFTAGEDGLLALRGLLDLVLEEIRRSERIVTTDCGR